MPVIIEAKKKAADFRGLMRSHWRLGEELAAPPEAGQEQKY
jgi:hypothetical protein